MNRTSDATRVSQSSNVKRHSGMPAGPIDAVPGHQPSYRAAVIRPRPSASGEGTLRMDPPTDQPSSHPHATRLQDYVNWLNAQASPSASASARPNVAASPAGEDHRFAPITKNRSAMQSFFTSTAESPLATASTAKQSANDPSSPTFHRFDHPHEPASTTAAAHVGFPFVESEQSDLEAKFSQPRETNRPIDPASTQSTKGIQNTPSPETLSTLRDPANADLIAKISSAIAAVLNEQPEEQLHQQAAEYLHQQVHADAMETLDHAPRPGSNPSEINEDMLNDIVRQRMEQAIAERDASRAQTMRPIAPQPSQPNESPSVVFQTSSEAAAPPVPPPAAKPSKPAAPMVSIENRDAVSEPAPTAPPLAEIPVDLAAWDVSDFRWPVITNQMIVTGGQAVGGVLSAMLQQFPGRPRRVAVSGVGRAAGATSIAISVARWAVASGLRTLLVDADVASPALSGRVGMAANMSWLNGISSELPTSELIIRSRKTNLCLMPLAASVTRVTWPRFIFDNLGELLQPVQDRFDLILVDTGPASQLLDELSSPQRLIDGLLLINDTEDPRKLETFKTRLTTFGIDRFIIADNRVPNAASHVA